MKAAGYRHRYHDDDWIMEDGKVGRFHAKKSGKDGVHIHYDVYLRGDRGEIMHVTFKLTEYYKGEVKRIAAIAKEMRKLKVNK